MKTAILNILAFLAVVALNILVGIETAWIFPVSLLSGAAFGAFIMRTELGSDVSKKVIIGCAALSLIFFGGCYFAG
jgi:hypothetical protein